MLCILLVGCNTSDLKQAIEEYTGDGKIRLLEAPPLGTPGCAIEMPHFDLSKHYTAEYVLTGLPPGMEYTIFLIVEDRDDLETIVQGIISYTIKKNGLILRKISSKISKLRNSRENGKNRFYSDDPKSKIIVIARDDNWSLSVESMNPMLKRTVETYIEISAGGFK